MASLRSIRQENPEMSTAELHWLYYVKANKRTMDVETSGDIFIDVKLAGYPGAWKIPKAQLVEKSDFFRAMLSGSFQVSQSLPSFVCSVS